MADTVDRFNEDQEFLLKVTKPNLNKEVEATGFCLYCGEPLKKKGQRWCDAECRNLWEHEQTRRRQQ